jgi:acyl-CoA thioesterase
VAEGPARAGSAATARQDGQGSAGPRAGAPAADTFERDTAVRRLRPSDSAAADASRASFAAEVSSDWRAGRGPHGGYLAAMVLRALTETVAEPARTPRSLTIHYARAPRPGPVRIDTLIERKGRSLSTLSARMEQDGELMALVLAAFSVPWTAPEIAELPMPEVEPPDAARETSAPLAEQVTRGLAPQFLRQLVVQPRIGDPPFSGSTAPMEVAAWLGLRDAARPVDALALALFSDALFSPPFVRLNELATSPTVELTIHFRTGHEGAATEGAATEGADPANLCFARFRTALVREGFFEEDGVIWSAGGTPLVQSRQLAILMPLGR